MSFQRFENGVEYFQDATLGCPHGFFTRKGGVSSGEIAGLNCGRGAEDKPANVDENRNRVQHALGAKTPVQTVFQCHSSDVLTIDKPIKNIPKCDAIVTATQGVPIGVLTADCAPILFSDIKAGVVGASHAGWRGAFGGIASKTIDAMCELGAHRDNIRAVVGPCISMNNYEVGQEFVEQFTDENPNFFEYFAGDDRIHFNLPRFVLDRIREAGVENCEWVGECTYEDEARYYSYRRATHCAQADYGRLIHVIMLPI